MATISPSRKKPGAASKGEASSGINPVWGNDPAYTVTEAAKHIGIPPKTLYRHIADRRVPSIKIVGKVMVRRSALLALIEKSTVEAI